jgi:hypothetical protein
MPIGTIASIVVAYVAIAVLLLSLNLFSLWRWWVKASAIVISGLFFIGSYLGITSILGWPTQARVPDRFSLVATRTVEPNQATGDAGSIYLWVETLGDNNVPSGVPISYQLGYSNELADVVDQAQARLNGGERVEGSLSQIKGKKLSAQPGVDPSQSGSMSEYELPSGWNLMFSGMPAVQLPEKGVL